jgi:ribosomal RNA-processing protein 9
MPDSFFSAPSRKRKRERNSSSTSKGKRKGSAPSKPDRRRRQPASSEESDDLDSGVGSQEDVRALEDESSDDGAGETVAQKRLRLAEMYLESLGEAQKEAAAEGFDAQDLDRDIIAERLQSDVVSLLFSLYQRSAS